jgi:cytoskeletal protein CcmA (bactofilin family)
MWKRDEAVRPASPQPMAAPQPAAPTQAGTPGPRAEMSHSMEKDIVNIGKSVVIKGELNGSEDLTIEGHVEGTIQLREHVLTIGPNGKIKAQVFAKAVIVLGEVTGNVTASDKVDIRDNGSVDGDIISPRVAIAEGAHFRGSVDMQRKSGAPGQPAQAVQAAQPAQAVQAAQPAQAAQAAQPAKAAPQPAAEKQATPAAAPSQAGAPAGHRVGA